MILTWHIADAPETGSNGPVFYMENDCAPTALKVKAGIAPDADDMTYEILDDDVSILDDYATLPKGQTVEDMGENIKRNAVIEAGSWVSLSIVNPNGAKDVSINLILEKIE